MLQRRPPKSVVVAALLLGLLAGCVTTATVREEPGSLAECEVQAETHAVYEAALDVFHEHLKGCASYETLETWVSLGGSEATIETRPDGSQDRFQEKGELVAKLHEGALVIEVRRDAPAPGTTVVRVRVHEAHAADGSESSAARELLERIVARVQRRST